MGHETKEPSPPPVRLHLGTDRQLKRAEVQQILGPFCAGGCESDSAATVCGEAHGELSGADHPGHCGAGWARDVLLYLASVAGPDGAQFARADDARQTFVRGFGWRKKRRCDREVAALFY
jgi:hypothetical protein